MLALLLVACVLPHRVVKSLLAPDYMTPVEPTGQVAVVTYQTGEKGEAPQAFAPPVFEADGRTFYRAVEVSSAGWIDVAPMGDDVSLSVWVRNPGLAHRDDGRSGSCGR